MPLRRGRNAVRPPLDLVVVGHVNVDRILEVDALPAPDRTAPVRRVRSSIGGPAANLALAAATLDLKVAVVARLGAEFPSEYVAELDRGGVDRSGLEIVPRRPTPTCWIVHDRRGRQMTLIDQGPMGDPGEGVVPRALLRRAAWVHVGTGDPGYLGRVVDEVRSNGGRIAVDPGPEIHYRWTQAAFGEHLAQAEVLFGNRGEIAAICRLLRCSGPRALVDLVPLIVMTEGARGARAYFRGGTASTPVVGPRRVGDPTGAGDAFRAGFYGAWLRGRPIAASLRLGAATAGRWLGSRHRAGRRGSRA